MSTPTHSIKANALDDQLNKQIHSGDVLGALEKLAARRWKNGKIVHERFYYHKG